MGNNNLRLMYIALYMRLKHGIITVYIYIYIYMKCKIYYLLLIMYFMQSAWYGICSVSNMVYMLLVLYVMSTGVVLYRMCYIWLIQVVVFQC